jgi:phosphate transport system ATP-binding protein
MTSVANDPRGPEGGAQRLPEEEPDDRSRHRHIDADGTAKNRSSAPMPDLAPMTQETAPDTDVSVEPETPREVVFDVDDIAVTYSGTTAVEGIRLEIAARQITAFIGPSGCGKSTFLRCLNRMNDLVLGAEVHGSIRYHGVDLYGSDVDAVEVRRRIGMVFQKPNPFPKSIYDNVAFGPRVNGMRSGLDDVVERALRRAALWEEVKDKLKESAFALSGGQQQRLCIARCLAVEPDVILMDEPCSALDPIATGRIEDLMAELKQDYTIVIVTHNMQQAARASDMTAFLTTDVGEEGKRIGRLVEYDTTSAIFTAPSDPRTEGYITGRFG